MQYLYILAISYITNDHAYTSHILLESRHACQVAIRAAEELSTAMPADLACIKSDKYKIIKPKLRPEGM